MQRLGRLDPGRAVRRHGAGRGGDEREQHGHRGERRGVRGADAVHEACQRPAERERTRDSDREAREAPGACPGRRPCGSRLRPARRAPCGSRSRGCAAARCRTARCRCRRPPGGAQAGERGEQQHREALVRERFAQPLLHGRDVDHGLLGVHGVDRASDGRGDAAGAGRRPHRQSHPGPGLWASGT